MIIQYEGLVGARDFPPIKQYLHPKISVGANNRWQHCPEKYRVTIPNHGQGRYTIIQNTERWTTCPALWDKRERLEGELWDRMERNFPCWLGATLSKVQESILQCIIKEYHMACRLVFNIISLGKLCPYTSSLLIC